MDLTSYFAKQPPDQGVLETSFYHFDHGTKLMGTGLATGVILLYYNKELFDAAKLPYPPATAQDAWTWDAFAKYAEEAKKGCPVSKALSGTKIGIKATLDGE